MTRFLGLIAFGAFLSSAVAQDLYSSAPTVDLVEYTRAHVHAPAQPGGKIPKYNRMKHFGGWVHQDPAKDCFNTRHDVLAREDDPSTPVKYSSTGCTIVSGSWHEPYAGEDIKKASELQIDHVVPLANAYYAGAYAWEPAIRCNYANFLANNYHLVAVLGHENMSKGDKGPDQYLPPNEDDLCVYVSSWMKIKAIWQLTATAEEFAAVQKVLSEQRCDSSARYMDTNELASLRHKAAAPIKACEDFGSQANDYQ